MAISKIAGQMLKNTLERDGSNLAISDTVADTPVVFVDVVNSRVGINNANPTVELDITGNVIANNLFSSNTVSATGNIIGGNVNTAGVMSATGNITGNFFIGNGSQLTGIDATSIQNGNSNVKVYANANVATSVGGNANVFVVTGTGANVAGTVNATGNITGNFFIGNGSQLTGIDATSIQNGNSNVKVYANSDVATSVAGTANVFLVTGTGANVAGTVNTTGNLVANGVTLSGNAISATSGILSLGSNANITITGGTANYVLSTNGSGNLTWSSAADIGVVGNLIPMGTNTLGNLVSNAVTLTTTTTVTDGITQLNTVLGKLVPPSPANFPGGQTLSISGLATYRMANITQVDNTPAANKAVAAGATVTTVLRVATYSTNTISTVGPGDTGTITAVRNGANVGNVTLNAGASPTANGTYGGNLVITNNFDYRNANANIAAGFWYVFSSSMSGTAAPAGWNELYIADSATGNTNTPVWYYDNSAPATPSFSAGTMTPPGSPTLLYSSTIPHYTNATQFAISANVANVSGNTYPTSNTLASGSAAGSFAAPASVNYSASNIGSNVLGSFASASFSTTANITTGFGGSSTGPSISVNNSYSTGTLTLTSALGNIALYKSGTATAIDEGNVVVTSVGTGSGNAVRIINPGSGNTPVFTGSEANFNSQSSTLETYDATVVGSGVQGVLKHDQTNYSTGYLPAGPNLSAGRSGTQYFTIKFVRTNVSKFDITYAGNVAGMWVALPGSVIDASSGANGWIAMTTAYAGAGYPGVNSPGNGSDGCALGGVVVPNVNTASTNKTCTFGTVSSSSTATNEIYVRIALTSGQTVTGLSLNTASN
jgi:hypothetical protein